NCTGAVRLEVEGLPDKVRAEQPVTLAADQDAVRIPLRAADDAEGGERTVRVRATLGDLRAEGPAGLTGRGTPGGRISTPATVTAERRQYLTVAFRLLRRNYPGPVEVRLEGLPEGVRARPAAVPAGADAGRLELAVGGRTEQGTCEVRAIATGADVRAETL